MLGLFMAVCLRDVCVCVYVCVCVCVEVCFENGFVEERVMV